MTRESPGERAGFVLKQIIIPRLSARATRNGQDSVIRFIATRFQMTTGV